MKSNNNKKKSNPNKSKCFFSNEYGAFSFRLNEFVHVLTENGVIMKHLDI